MRYIFQFYPVTILLKRKQILNLILSTKVLYIVPALDGIYTRSVEVCRCTVKKPIIYSNLIDILIQYSENYYLDINVGSNRSRGCVSGQLGKNCYRRNSQCFQNISKSTSTAETIVRGEDACAGQHLITRWRTHTSLLASGISTATNPNQFSPGTPCA